MSSSTVQKIDKFHEAHKGKFVFAAVELTAAAALAAWAVDTGAIWQYLLTVILAVGGLRNLVNALIIHNHGSKKSKRR